MKYINNFLKHTITTMLFVFVLLLNSLICIKLNKNKSIQDKISGVNNLMYNDGYNNPNNNFVNYNQQNSNNLNNISSNAYNPNIYESNQNISNNSNQNTYNNYNNQSNNNYNNNTNKSNQTNNNQKHSNSFFNNSGKISVKASGQSEARYDRTTAINLARDLLKEVVNNSTLKNNLIDKCLSSLSSAGASSDENLKKFWDTLSNNYRNINNFSVDYLLNVMKEMEKVKIESNGVIKTCDQHLLPFKNGNYNLNLINNVLAKVFEKFNDFSDINSRNDYFDGHRMYSNREKLPSGYFSKLNEKSRE